MQHSNTNKDSQYSIQGGMVHFILSHSYFLFLLAVVLGAIMHTFFAIELFEEKMSSYIGLAMLFIGPMLIYWAQSTSRKLPKNLANGAATHDFARGPYKYSRNPTHIGLTIMTLGLGFILNSFFSIVFIIIASIISKYIFLKKQEQLLEQKYGEPYRDYKKKVNTWV